MSNKKRILAIGVFFYSLILTASALFAGYHLRAIWPPASEEYRLLKEAHQLLAHHYMGKLPDQLSLERGMIHGMVGKLDDPYTIYIEPASHELQTDDLTGEYGGIGAYLSRGEDQRIYLIPFEDGPAARAGIIEGDILIAVDHQIVEADASLEMVVAMVRGPVETSVNLTLAAREVGETPLTLDIVREAIPIPSVTCYLMPSNPEIGVIVITIFSERTPAEVEGLFLELEARGMQSMVLDLRDNAGGLLDSGVAVARYFLSDGLVIIEERRGGEEEIYRVEVIGEAAYIPLAILINGGTASAAEVVAAALQANHRAPLIGMPTFGKGSVQLVLELYDQSSLHVTAARWKTPDGYTLDNHGLEPDIHVTPNNGDRDAILLAAIEWLQAEQ